MPGPVHPEVRAVGGWLAMFRAVPRSGQRVAEECCGGLGESLVTLGVGVDLVVCPGQQAVRSIFGVLAEPDRRATKARTTPCWLLPGTI